MTNETVGELVSPFTDVVNLTLIKQKRQLLSSCLFLLTNICLDRTKFWMIILHLIDQDNKKNDPSQKTGIAIIK